MRKLYLLTVFMPLFAFAGPDAETLKSQGPALLFLKNEGQITDQYNHPRQDIDYKLNAGNLAVFIGDGQIHYQWMKADRPAKENNFTEAGKIQQATKVKGMPETGNIDMYRMDIVLLGANKNAQIAEEDRSAYLENFYLPQHSGKVSSFGKVTYKNIYPNIDWVLYTGENGLKYDFIVHPGGNPSNIRLQYKGASSIDIKDGSVTATTPMGSITEQKPYSYDASTGVEIASSFVLDGNVLSFQVAPHNQSHDLVIDPYLQWATYCGSSDYDVSFDVASNSNGDVYTYGWTLSTSNIVTTGAHQVTITPGGWGYYDAFIVKYNSAGIKQWGTYYGGSNYDWFYAAACDGSGNIYVTGETYSSANIASPGAHKTTFSGNWDAMLVKFDNTGARVWGTYFGGMGSEDADVACDGSGNVYLCGSTTSSSGIATSGAYQTTFSGVSDGYLARFSSAGVLQWATYLGGTDYDAAHSIACDRSGNIYIGGSSVSTTGIATSGSHQASHGNAPTSLLNDGFIAKFSNSGSLIWGTYYGGSMPDHVTDLTCDTSGNVYASGYTESNNNIATSGSHQPALGNAAGLADGFIAKFNSSGVRQWASYYGGSTVDYLSTVRIGSNDFVYISGYTYSTNNIATSNGYKTTLSGANDIFLAEFTNSGARMWASYYGGPGDETPNFNTANGGSGWAGNNGGGLSVSPGKIYIGRATTSTVGISTTGAYQATFGGGQMDAFIASWLIDTTIAIDNFNDTVMCTGKQFALAYAAPQPFLSGNTFTAQLSDASGSFVSPTNLGTVTATGGGTFNITFPSNIPAGNGYRIRIVSTLPVRISPDNGKNIKVLGLMTVTAAANTPLCMTDTLFLSATATTTGIYSWAGPNSFNINNKKDIYRFPLSASDNGDYIVTLNNSGCIAKDTINVSVLPTPAPLQVSIIANPGVAVTAQQTVTFTAIILQGDPTSAIKWYKNGVLITTATGTTYQTNGLHTGDSITIIATSNNPCAIPKTATYKVVIVPALGMENISDPGNIYLYPNPNKGSFTINGLTADRARIEILTTLGQTIQSGNIDITSGTAKINANYPSGVYILRITSGYIHKLIPFTISE